MFRNMFDFFSFFGPGATIGFLIASIVLIVTPVQPCSFQGQVMGLDNFIRSSDWRTYPDCLANWSVVHWSIVFACAIAGYAGPKIWKRIN